jgi:hypothetical protein
VSISLRYFIVSPNCFKGSDITSKTPSGHAHGGMGGMGGAGGLTSLPGIPKSGDTSAPNPLALLAGGFTMDPDGYSIAKRVQSGICTNCTVFDGRITINYENGTRADISGGVYLHHVITVDISKKVPQFIKACGLGGAGMSTFLGGAVDGFTQLYTTIDGKFPSGFHVGNDQMMMQAEIVNYLKEPQKVWITVDYEWLPGTHGSDAYQTVLSALDCTKAGEKPKQGTKGEWKGRPTQVLTDGTIVVMRGHMVYHILLSGVLKS